MTNKLTFADRMLQYNERLANESIDLPDQYKIINPFQGKQKDLVKRVTTAFYQKYYNDCENRHMILGSSPARRGSAVTGVPFEDANHLQQETGILIDEFFINHSSQGFLYDVVSEYGGSDKFYADFYMNFVCPLGIIRNNSKGKEVNCNYYENNRIQEVLLPFIIRSIREQLDLGIDTSVCYCIGSGENYNFLSKLNKECGFFEKIIPLEHPRFITQYNSKNVDYFKAKYLDALHM